MLSAAARWPGREPQVAELNPDPGVVAVDPERPLERRPGERVVAEQHLAPRLFHQRLARGVITRRRQRRGARGRWQRQRPRAALRLRHAGVVRGSDGSVGRAPASGCDTSGAGASSSSGSQAQPASHVVASNATASRPADTTAPRSGARAPRCQAILNRPLSLA
jgi:hypothetical protein